MTASVFKFIVSKNVDTPEVTTIPEAKVAIPIKVETPVAIISEPTANLVAKPDVKKVSAEAENTAVQSALSFNDTDSVLDMGTNKVDNIEAPKTIERLEKISDVRNEQRKLEEEQYDDDEDENDTIKIHGDADVALSDLDVHDVGSTLKITDDPILTDIEVLS